MPKKQRNSFYFFMKEMQEQEAAKGRTVTMKTLPNLAHPIWAKLSLVEREPYEDMARKYKNNPNLQHGGKLMSDGQAVEDYLRENEEKLRLENVMQSDIRTHIDVYNVDEDTFKENASRQLFYFLSFNIVCKAEDVKTEQNIFVPNEVGIVEYSIKHGIHREFHRLIHTGFCPKGYAREANDLCELKHKISHLSPPDCSERNLSSLFDDIKKFLKNTQGHIPPLFCAEEDLEQTRGCLKWLAKNTGERLTIDGHQELYRVWNANYLLMELRCGVGHPLPSVIIANDLLTKTCFNYHPDARCEYHDELDVHYCALAYSKRLCYLISDAVCNQFDIMTTEQHMPPQHIEVSYMISRPNVNPQRKPLVAMPPRLDQRNSFYQNEGMQPSHFNTSVAPIQPRPVAAAAEEPAQPVPRQPATSCLAAQFAQLKMKSNMVTAVPGIGIGRGQPRKI